MRLMTAVYMVIWATMVWLCVSMLVAILLGAVIQAARGLDGGRVRGTKSPAALAEPPAHSIR